MMNEAVQILQLTQFPPWHLQGEAFILNYWINPQFIRRHPSFHIAPSAIGRVVQVMLIRYQQSPIGAYDELLLLDHPILSKRRLSSIPKIFVSTQISVMHGQKLWGIPKELADFEWQTQEASTICQISSQEQSLALSLTPCKKARPFYINSHHIPRSMLKIQQAWQGQRYEFYPQFRAKLVKLRKFEWQTQSDLFPDFSQAKALQSFYVPQFQLIFPEAKVRAK